MLLTVLLFTKAGLGPLIFWVPVVFRSLSWLPLIWVQTIMKLPSLCLLFRVDVWTLSVVILCLIRMALASLLGLTSLVVKKILAYSRVTHTRFIILAHIEAMGFWYFWVYRLMIRFVIAILRLADLRVLRQPSRILGFSVVTLAASSVLGLPPTIGFLLKLRVISCFISSGYWSGYALMLFLGFNAYMYLSLFLQLRLRVNSQVMSGVRATFSLKTPLVYLRISLLLLTIAS